MVKLFKILLRKIKGSAYEKEVVLVVLMFQAVIALAVLYSYFRV